MPFRRPIMISIVIMSWRPRGILGFMSTLTTWISVRMLWILNLARILYNLEGGCQIQRYRVRIPSRLIIFFFILFFRDILFFDAHRSQKFCGKRSTPVNNGSNLAFSGGQGTRFYVEETDREMDLWIKISKRTPTFQPSPRRLKITVTVIRKDCGRHNPYYRQCSHTDHCIRREFFCDGRINCAWPDAEHGGTDEVNCDAEGKKMTTDY